jgi:beta-lactamase family protein
MSTISTPAPARKPLLSLALRIVAVFALPAFSLGCAMERAEEPPGDSPTGVLRPIDSNGGGSASAGSTPAPEGATPEPSPTPEPEPTPEVGADLQDLEASMAAAIDEYWVDGNYAIAVTDLQTGETVGHRMKTPQMSGCVMNLYVMYQVARDLEAGRYDLEDVDALMRATTWSSNAVTAWELYKIAGDGDVLDGVRRVSALVRDLGLDAVILDHPPGYPDDSLGRDYNNWVTAESTNMALAALWNGDVVGDEYREYLLEVLSEVKPGLNYLTAAVPEGIVSHKNGFFVGDTGYVDNDAGIIRLDRDGREYAYAVSFLAEEVPTKYGDVVLGQQLSTLAYNVMAARYP